MCAYQMHIHWIANTIVPPPISLGGGDRIMVECIRRWKDQHTITVYGNEGARQLCDYFKLEGIRHVTWPADHLKRYGRFFWWFAQTVKGCRGVDKLTLPPDEKHVIIASTEFQPNGMPAFRLKKRYPHVPMVMESFLLAPKWFSGKRGPGLIFTAYRPVQKVILRRVLRESEMLLVTGEEDREFMIDEGRTPDSVFAVLGGVDLSIPQSVPEPKEKSYDAIFIGRLHPQKGPLELLDIWKMLVQKKPDARLAIIGSGPLEAQCRDKAQKLELGKNVEFFGFRDGVEKYKIVKASRVVLHPAVYDSGGMAAAEALCCGLPGVSFDLPALRTYYPRGFLKAPTGDLPGFADRIHRLLTDEKLYAETSKEAYAAGLEWDWNARAGAIWTAIERGIAPRSKPFFQTK
jgi:glycosyltransferase involved in cell wall biosynthesis